MNKVQSRPSKSLNVQKRISQLEDLILSRMNASTAVQSPDQSPTEARKPSITSPSDVANTRKDDSHPKNAAQLDSNLGHVSVGGPETTYVESAHWTVILDSIAELRECLAEGPDPTEAVAPSSEPYESDGPDLLCGGYKYVESQDIMAAIPPRPLVDRLVSKFFASIEEASMIIHGPTFFKEYDHFWSFPQETSMPWVSLLFGMMCLALLYDQSTPDEYNDLRKVQPILEPNLRVQVYREKAAQCLMLCQYIKGGPYIIEALLLYLHIEYLRGGDPQNSAWMIFGIIVRLALRMGYHRDASAFPKISPFHAEMRRRGWTIIRMMDVITSMQFGLPRMINESQSDTKEPRNLQDEDMLETMTELPSSRPDSARTTVQFYVTKSRVSRFLSTEVWSLLQIKGVNIMLLRSLDDVKEQGYLCEEDLLILKTK